MTNKQIFLFIILNFFFITALAGFIRICIADEFDLLGFIFSALWLSATSTLLFDVILYKLKEKQNHISKEEQLTHHKPNLLT